MIRRHLVIRGQVQGVGFRFEALRTATDLGVSGWVRNRDDGTVEAAVEGEPEPVESFVAWCRTGPESADVTSVEVSEIPTEATVTFDIRH